MKMTELAALLGLALAGVTAAGVPAEAATYRVAGGFSDGATLTGSFDYDGSAFSDVNIMSGSPDGSIYTSVLNYGYNPFSSSWNFRLFNDPYDLSIVLDGPLTDPAASLISGYESRPSGYRDVSSFTVTSAAVVPLPAALPLAASALAGLGGLGWLKRRRTHANVTAAI